jgi:Rieske Fe-S protein
VKSVIHHLVQKENLKSMLNILNLEGKVVVGNNVAKTDDLLLNKDAFRTWQLIRLPAELGGDKNDVSAFRLYSAVCLHLWCLWRYVPLERDSNDPSRIINGSGQCPCHGSAYDPLNRKGI